MKFFTAFIARGVFKGKFLFLFSRQIQPLVINTRDELLFSGMMSFEVEENT